MTPKENEFFLGSIFDLKTGKADMEQLVHYDPADLTTHCVITGMTGSGKTGLGVILLEEAALQGIPAIMIDPKGDLTNHLLHFPDLRPSDFKPWVDEDSARRDGKTIEQAADDAANLWQKGLSGWGIDKQRIQKLSINVDYAIYTPGSDSGIPVSILASLECPEIPWETNKEILRERISSTVTALLELIGLKDIDPVRSREHILLSNIFESAWSQGLDLNLESLILQTQAPPFDKLGVFPLSKFYPEKDRFDLAILLNNFLAAPAFHSWLEGQPLDIASLLYTDKGKPRHSIFYIAHLSDEERMFFVTLLYSAVETWMRGQSGSQGLRALVYFDEIVGYLPPISNPPSKPIILRMLKQARAFGVGLALATQNPIDLDYKALSNAGTWMIGKLQTDQDKQRLLDGLEGLASGLDRNYFDKTISELGKRAFLLHNVHEKKPLVFTTRWAMNYLAGPITRNRLGELNKLVGAGEILNSIANGETSEGTGKEDISMSPGSSTQPTLSSSVQVYYQEPNRSLTDALSELKAQLPAQTPAPDYIYKPALIGQAKVFYTDRTHNIDHEAMITASIKSLEKRGLVRWEEFLVENVDINSLQFQPLPNANFEPLIYPVDDEATIADLSKDFVDWIYRSRQLKLQYNDVLKLIAEPDESPADFRKRCSDEVSKQLESETEAINAKYKKKKESIDIKLAREKLELEQDKRELNQRRLDEAGKGLENVMKLLGSRKLSLSTSMTKRRMTSSAKDDVKESEQMIEIYEKQLADLDLEATKELDLLKEQLTESVGSIKEVSIAPLKKNIILDVFGVIWLPYYAFKTNDSWLETKAFK